ncbi:hypothetical protein ACRQ5Q_10300 [Bradyrhizobium sp. PMVTL-01]
MAQMSPLGRRMIEDMTVHNLLTPTQTIVSERGIEVQPKVFGRSTTI